MLLALWLLAGFSALVPARWNSSDPRSLDLLAGGPVNCILVEPPHWNPALLAAAKRRGIAAFGVLHPDKDAPAAAVRALALKLDGLALEGDGDWTAVRAAVSKARMTLVELPDRGRMRLDGADRITGAWQGLWPGVEIEHPGGEKTSGPTSTPWIDTNTGFLRFVRASTDAAIWVGERPPRGVVFPARRYCLAVADAAIAGARWIVALDADLERRIHASDRAGRAAWRQIEAYLRYFENPRWRDYRPFSEMAVVQDRASGGLLSGSILDMLSALHKAARAEPADRVGADSLRGTRVVLDVTGGAVNPEGKKNLDAFVRAGGVLVSPPPGWRFPEIAEGQAMPTRAQMDRIQPVWEAAYDATVGRNFGVRTFNTASVLFHLLAAPGGGSLLIHLLNYADYAAEDITVQALGEWRRARLYTPEGAVRELPVYPVKDGTGVDVDRIEVLATLRLD